MTMSKKLRSVVAAVALTLIAPPSAATADEITFASLTSNPGTPSIFLSLTDLSLMSFDIPKGTLDAGDPFAVSSPIVYTQGGTAAAFLKMPTVGFTGFADPDNAHLWARIVRDRY